MPAKPIVSVADADEVSLSDLLSHYNYGCNPSSPHQPALSVHSYSTASTSSSLTNHSLLMHRYHYSNHTGQSINHIPNSNSTKNTHMMVKTNTLSSVLDAGSERDEETASVNTTSSCVSSSSSARDADAEDGDAEDRDVQTPRLPSLTPLATLPFGGLGAYVNGCIVGLPHSAHISLPPDINNWGKDLSELNVDKVEDMGEERRDIARTDIDEAPDTSRPPPSAFGRSVTNDAVQVLQAEKVPNKSNATSSTFLEKIRNVLKSSSGRSKQASEGKEEGDENWDRAPTTHRGRDSQDGFWGNTMRRRTSSADSRHSDHSSTNHIDESTTRRRSLTISSNIIVNLSSNSRSRSASLSRRTLPEEFKDITATKNYADDDWSVQQQRHRDRRSEDNSRRRRFSDGNTVATTAPRVSLSLAVKPVSNKTLMRPPTPPPPGADVVSRLYSAKNLSAAKAVSFNNSDGGSVSVALAAPLLNANKSLSNSPPLPPLPFEASDSESMHVSPSMPNQHATDSDRDGCLNARSLERTKVKDLLEQVLATARTFAAATSTTSTKDDSSSRPSSRVSSDVRRSVEVRRNGVAVVSDKTIRKGNDGSFWIRRERTRSVDGDRHLNDVESFPETPVPPPPFSVIRNRGDERGVEESSGTSEVRRKRTVTMGESIPFIVNIPPPPAVPPPPQVIAPVVEIRRGHGDVPESTKWKNPLQSVVRRVRSTSAMPEPPATTDLFISPTTASPADETSSFEKSQSVGMKEDDVGRFDSGKNGLGSIAPEKRSTKMFGWFKNPKKLGQMPTLPMSIPPPPKLLQPSQPQDSSHAESVRPLPPSVPASRSGSASGVASKPMRKVTASTEVTRVERPWSSGGSWRRRSEIVKAATMIASGGDVFCDDKVLKKRQSAPVLQKESEEHIFVEYLADATYRDDERYDYGIADGYGENDCEAREAAFLPSGQISKLRKSVSSSGESAIGQCEFQRPVEQEPPKSSRVSMSHVRRESAEKFFQLRESLMAIDVSQPLNSQHLLLNQGPALAKASHHNWQQNQEQHHQSQKARVLPREGIALALEDLSPEMKDLYAEIVQGRLSFEEIVKKYVDVV